MSDPYALARTLLVFKVLTDRMNELRRGDLMDEAAKVMPPGTRLPVLVGDEHAGWVQMPKPTTSVTVTDESALRAFVTERFPTEVETVTRVRPAFLEALKRAARDHNGWVDRDSGEVTPIPGIKVEAGTPSPRTSPGPDAYQAVLAAARRGELGNVAGLLELPAGGGEVE